MCIITGIVIHVIKWLKLFLISENIFIQEQIASTRQSEILEQGFVPTDLSFLKLVHWSFSLLRSSRSYGRFLTQLTVELRCSLTWNCSADLSLNICPFFVYQKCKEFWQIIYGTCRYMYLFVLFHFCTSYETKKQVFLNCMKLHFFLYLYLNCAILFLTDWQKGLWLWCWVKMNFLV
jgi:hypothetical protein